MIQIKKAFLKIYKAAEVVFGGYGIGKFYPIRIAHAFFLKQMKLNFIIVQGHKMFLDSKDSLNLSLNGTYEEFETELFKKEIKESDIILDIGANIGYFTLIFAQIVGNHGKVFAFEPDPTNFALLKKNVEINGYENIVLINKAVSNKSGKLKLFLSDDNRGDHRIYDSYDGRNFVEIESIKLDDFFNDYNGKIDFVKMDVQGAEFLVVQGMLNLLNKNKNMKIISEYWPMGLKRSGAIPEEYLLLLLDLGFNLSNINETQKKIETITFKNLLEEYTPEKENYTNLLCLRERT